MKEELKFSLYSVLKNEDANPFIGDDVLVIADGLGGSGSTVHSIDRTKFPDMKEEIMKSAFYDFDIERLVDLQYYLDELLVPMIDENADTSALWGSRIAIARFIYALLKNEEFINANLCEENVRKKLVEYITQGLVKTRAHFDLQKGKYENQLILPTTLAALRYKKINEDYFVEAIWAGDSRCYCLTAKGLKQLSVDDEDLSGALTNLFYADKNNSHLNYKSFKFSEACILIVVSDGFFDPFDPHDNFGFECTLLDCINKCQSIEELKQMLFEIYTSYHADDATMAFVPLGLEHYSDIKSLLEERIKYINEMYQKFKDNKEYMNLCNENERSYVEQRIDAKYEMISDTIIDCLINHKPDILVSKHIQEIFDKCNDNKELLKKLMEEYRSDLSSKLIEFLCEYKEFPFVDTEKRCNKVKKLQNIFKDNIYLKSKINETEGIIQQLIELKSQINGELENIAQELCQFIGEENNQKYLASKDIKYHLKRLFSIILVIRSCLYKSKKFDINLPSLPQNIKCDFLQKLYNDLESTVHNIYVYSEISKLQDILEKDQSSFKSNEQNMGEVLTPTAIEELLSQIDFEKIGCEPINEEQINQQLKADTFQSLKKYFREHKEEIVIDVLNSLSLNYEQTSLIDECFNKTKLDKFRLYYSLMTKTKTSFDKFSEELELLEKSYEI